MTIEDKKKLVCLLREYQKDLLKTEEKNKEVTKKYERWTQKYYVEYTSGIKSQYEHARVIANKLDKEVNDSITTF